MFVLATGLCLAACGHSREEKTAGDVGEVAVQAGNGESASSGTPAELPLPKMPDNLSNPQERADYVLLHFWDEMDFADRSLALDSAFMEQNFANFASVLPYATDEGRKSAVDALLGAARRSGEEQIDFVYGIAVMYLYQQESPMHNEEMFLPFVDWAEASNYYPDVARERRADILKNRPGTEAADFKFESYGGGKSSLKALRGTPVLLMFYEPDCTMCLDAEKRLAQLEPLRQAIAGGELRMLAVYVGDDRAGWEKHAATLPSDWMVGIDAAKRIDTDELYNIGATPSFYLIDPDGRVVLKDADLQQVLPMFE